jgi:hypothetical protein
MRPKLFIFFFCLALLPLVFLVQPSYAAQEKGTLLVTIEPMGAAQWAVSPHVTYYTTIVMVDGHPVTQSQPHLDTGLAEFHNSGESLSLDVGQRKVTYKVIRGWTTQPSEDSVEIRAGQTTHITKTFTRSPGQLVVYIETARAREAGAQWQVDGGSWTNSGTTISPAVGQHRVEFKEIPGWVKPEALQANVVLGETSILTRNYTEKGSLTVTLQPQEANTAGAKWSVDGSAWQDSGATVSNLRLASLRVAFKQINDARWITPEPINVNIASGQAAQATVTYQRSPGSLSVVIFPLELRQAGAQWRIAQLKGGGWQNSDAVLPVPEGQHQLEFKEVAGWVRPVTQEVNIASLQSIQLRGEYRRALGSLVVTIQPQEALAKGAQWRVNGGAWQNSGSTLSNVAAGQRSIEYKDIPGWIRPSQESANITGGQTTSLTKNYTQQSGSLQVTIQPNNVTQAGAQWRVGGGPWQASGATVSNLPVGNQTIEFKDVSGWIKPGSSSINITVGQTVQTGGTYRK